MKARLEKIKIYLVIAILFNILFPAFINYCDLVNDSFFPPTLNFENPGQETALADYLSRSNVFKTNSFSMIFPSVANLFDPLSNPSSQIASFDQETFTLRC